MDMEQVQPIGSKVTNQMISYLRSTKPWTKFLSVLGFIMVAFCVLMGIVLMFVKNVYPRLKAAPTFFVGIMYMLISLAALCSSLQAAEEIDMKEVRRLANLRVSNILADSQVESIITENYWNHVKGTSKPLVVFFYIDSDPRSQRIATLIRYIAPIYKDRVSFGSVKVADSGKVDPQTARRMASEYSLDKTPGILFYHRIRNDMVLDDEMYIDPDFKEFRAPRMILWKTYYSAVCKELDKLLAD